MIIELDRQQTAVDVQYWKQERLVFRVPTGTNEVVSVYNDLGTIANYRGFGSYLDIDLTDWVRANEEAARTNATYIYSDWNGDEWEINIQVAGLINPEDVIIPPTTLSFFPMLPPFRYIGGFVTIFEVFSEGGQGIAAPRWRSYANGAWSAYDILSDRGLAQRTIAANVERLQFVRINVPQNITETILIQEQDCGKEYALVRWVSFTGNTRQHVFELVKPKTSVADAYSLEPINNEYVEIKGRVDGFVLQLDNLNPYDVWYYSDLLTSSKVEVSLDGVKFDRVQITDKDVTIPTVDGTPSGKVEFNVNWKRYDAVSM